MSLDVSRLLEPNERTRKFPLVQAGRFLKGLQLRVCIFRVVALEDPSRSQQGWKVAVLPTIGKEFVGHEEMLAAFHLARGRGTPTTDCRERSALACSRQRRYAAVETTPVCPP